MRAIVLVLLALSLTACAGGDRSLRNLAGASDGPDEFAVTPGLPLQMPDSLSLPDPTPGGSNLTDTDPINDAVAALGGRQNIAGGIPAADAGLVAFAGRNGVSANIRETTAAEDQAFRNRLARFSLNVFRRGDRYYDIYARQALDAYAELERFRAAGVQTPSAPPQ